MKPNNKTENGSPFKIPEGYFETLSDRVILAVHDNEEESENLLEKKNSFTGLRPYLAYAAIITGLVIISVGVIKLTSKSGEDFISDNKGSSVFMTEVMSEEIDIYSIEAEVIKSDDQHSSISITYDDNMDNLIIENLEETDIYDLL